MRFEWDEAKRQQNLAKHGIDFADAVSVFTDPSALTLDDSDHDEERFVVLGMDRRLRVVVVVYTYRGDDIIRIISARKADKGERQQYEG
jgi:hypothetical protein